MSRISIFFILSVVAISCDKKSTSNKFSDSTFVRLYDYQDRRLSDSLVRFIDGRDVSLKRAAILAFASIQDTLHVNKLLKELSDQDEIVRRYAAFALGQTGGYGTETSLLSRLPNEKDSLARNEIYEALGRIIQQTEAGQLANDNDPALPWLYYRYGLRENTDSVIALHVSKFLSPGYPLSTRLGAAHLFARGKVGKQEFITDALVQSALHDPQADVRMAAAAGLKNMEPSASIEAIEKILQQEMDYRVRVNAIRSLAFFPFDKVKPLLFTSLNDTSINVGIAAAETIRQNITKASFKETFSLASRIKNWRVQAVVMEAVSPYNQGEVVEEALKFYSNSQNDYQKAALLPVIAQSIESFEFIRQELLSSATAVIQSASAASLVDMNRKDDFPDSLKQSFLETYKAAVEKGDVAVVGIVTDALMDTTLGYKKIVTEIDFLKKAQDKLSLPRDYESYVPLENTIAFFENREPLPVEKSFNHPIDWTLVKTIKADQQAVIKTTKGDISIQLFVEEAPGSVANFVDLVLRNYYDGKFFHRVVPNFVIQGGCPRGDGWGSEDYSIRSEFSGRKYKTGSVGMASAGKDTEGVQWFITHSPTPHLDGRYTIFAEVIKGMDVVHAIEVGDQILDIQLVDFYVQ